MTQTQAATATDPTISMNALRTGWDPNEPDLAPSQVSAADFGLIFSTAVDGQVYAQPIVAGSTIIVATENNHVYGIHAVTGAVLWSRSLGAPWPASAIGCGDLVPNIGVTSTPVYDASSGLVYLTAKVNDGPDANHPHWYLHALDVTTGSDHPGWPVTIQGAPANDPSNPIRPFTAHQRPGLLLLDGEVFAGFGSHCDAGPYVGYVVGVSTTTRALRMWATQDAASGRMAGIWMGGGGLVSDGPGRIFFSTGNGISPAPGPGNQPGGHLAESVVRLSTNSGASLTAKDFFSPSNADSLDQNDQDLGSGGPVALPSQPFGTPAHPNLMVQIGKDGRVFLLDRDDLGGRGQGPGGGDRVLGTTGPFRGVWGHPAVWGGDGGYLYVAENDGFLRALSYGVSGTGLPVLTSAGTSSAGLGHYPGSPVVTSTGTTSGSALVWVTCPGGPNGTNAQLRAYDAVPVNGVLTLRWSAPIGTAVKFPVAAVAGGRVYVGTRDGRLLAFGRPAQAALTGSPVDFGRIAVGATGAATATVTATRSVTVTAISTSTPFTVTPPALPATLNAGDTLAVPVGFVPTVAGGATAAVSFTVTVGGASTTIGLDLHGTGTQPGFGASPPSLSFGELATGSSMTLSVSITNTGTAPETVGSTTGPSAPFSASGLPTVGMQIAPGASITVSATYAPTAPSPTGGDSSQLTVTGTDNRSVTVPLSGTAVAGAPHLTISPTGLDFGQIPVGGSVTKTFDVSNTGNLVLTITKGAPPTAPFTTPNPIAEGQQLGPGAVIHQAVAFAPTAPGAATGQFLITGNDGQGPQAVPLTGTGVPGSGTVPAPSAASWTFNGAAALSGADLVLTHAVNGQTGSAVYNTAVPSAKLQAQFTVAIGGGTGADGMTFVMLDPSRTTSHALGVGGGGLGYSGLPGVAITLDTYRNVNDPSANFVAVATGGSGDALTYAATSTAIGNLRSGTHDVHVTVSAGRVHVSVDGHQAIDTGVTLPSAVLVGFTASTGGLNDTHAVRGVSISY